MYRDKKIGVVVPSYNEEEFVGDVIATVPALCDRIYVVDDGSTDRTWEVIERRAHYENHASGTEGGNDERPDRRVVPIQHETNRGVGGAIKTGYGQAYEDGMDIVVVMAGDGQMDPDNMDRLLDPIVDGEADYAKGTRLPDRRYRRKMSAWRLCGTLLLTYLTRIASGYWHLSDSQNGYTAISHEALTAVDVDDLFEDYGFCNDLLVKLSVHDLEVVDVPMEIHYGEEDSYIRYRSFVPKLLSLLARAFLWRIKTEYLRDGSPEKSDDDSTPQLGYKP